MPEPITVTYRVGGSEVNSGDFFPGGIHEIIAIAENDCWLVTCAFTLIVEDTEAPVFVITHKQITKLKQKLKCCSSFSNYQ